MSGQSSKVGVIVASQESFVPESTEVVSPQILAQVFEGGVVPLKLNADGSVAIEDYVAWLSQQGEYALFDLNAHSEIVTPKKSLVRNDQAEQTSDRVIQFHANE